LLRTVCLHCEQEARHLGLAIPTSGPPASDFPVFQSPGKLPANLRDSDMRQAEAAIVKIATAYLKIAEEYGALGCNHLFSSQELQALVPEHINEERLRTFKAAIHNLQAVYDTHIQDTPMEANDPRLLKLRGCISMALHLLEIATELVHFHERHEHHPRHAGIYQRLQAILGQAHLLEVMGNYALFYCTKFLQTGKQLSAETMLDYAQITSQRIPIPLYRGFHVRPASYIAGIVRHYGAAVHMHFSDEVYDAGCAFDLFRANEEINMEKRRVLARKLQNLPNLTASHRELLPQYIQQTLDALVTEHVLIVHQTIAPSDLFFNDLEKPELTTEDVRAAVNAVITRLLAAGKVDICLPILVTFIGDRRAVQDIALLAEYGYGEDARGNNIALPKAIVYLHK
jgi:hypothetical protein